MESEGEWATNKKLIDLSKIKNGDIRRAIPKGFSYFSVDFGLQCGYAHAIEDEESFPSNFAQEIIGGMLDLDHKRWRKQESLDFEKQKKNCEDFKLKWADYDWTERAKQRREES
uniref:CwfJ_C_2 domain-containing protein n=1 Tax=Steinernema glaseri TaxID=37863 RepID=A0A1I7ZQB4_9BILA